MLLAQPIGIRVQLDRYVWQKFPEEFGWFAHAVVIQVDFYYPWFLWYFTFALSTALFLKGIDARLTYLGPEVDLLTLSLFWFFLYLDQGLRQVERVGLEKPRAAHRHRNEI